MDYQSIKCGDDIQDAVREHCRRAFGLVQIIEHESFKEPLPPALNWCHEEYQEFSKMRRELGGVHTGGRSKVYFLISGNTIKRLKPANLGPYQNWYQQIAAVKYVSMEGINTKKLRQEIQDIARDLHAWKATIIDALVGA